ncbi:MAG: radical SAM protein [Armatimonadota bacterium]|nr:radical SAM protein [Armatimonadota bacterium]
MQPNRTNDRFDGVIEDMTTAEVKEMLTFLADAGVSNISFTGGEPLLREDICEIVAFAAGLEAVNAFEDTDGVSLRRSRPSLYMNTNGALSTSEFLKVCLECGLRLTVSLPGLRTYQELTAGGDARKALGAMEAASAMGVQVTAAITITRINEHELVETIAAALLAGADSILLNRFLAGGRGLGKISELSLDVDQVKRMLLIADEVLHTAGRYGRMGTEVPACLIAGLQFRNLTVGTRCSAALHFVAIDPSGYVRVCNHSPVRLCHYTDIDSVWQHPLWQAYTRRSLLPTSCSGCHSRPDCDAGCREAARLVSGDPMVDDPCLLFDAQLADMNQGNRRSI